MSLERNYVFSDNYDDIFSNIFYVTDIPESTIDFIEVCLVNKKQVCIKRSAIMKRLFANVYGDLFFEGLCSELGKERFFELLMSEHIIDGREQSTNTWFSQVTGKLKHNFNLECERRKSRVLWEGLSDTTEFTDVFSDIFGGITKQMVVKRNVKITAILADIRDTIYITFYDSETGLSGITYPTDLKFKFKGREYSFETWCRKSIEFDLWESFPDD